MSLDEAAIDAAIDVVLAGRTKPAPRPTGARRHWGRKAAKAERYVCIKTIDCVVCGGSMADTTPCHLAIIFYPPGVPKIGCGRNFSTSNGLHVEHPKMFSDPVRYPYGCLSDILAADERKVK